jgi:beta-lactamase regulating signal transducer with metallopeptidase domain/flagellar biosynthesis protein FliQ
MDILQIPIVQVFGIWVAVSCLSGLLIFIIIKIFDAIFSIQSSTDQYHKNIVALLFFFLLNMVGTFYFQENYFEEEQMTTITKLPIPDDKISFESSVLENTNDLEASTPTVVKSFNMESLLNYLGVFWIAGALVFTIKMMGGYFYTRSLIISSQRSIPENWNYFVVERLEKLKIKGSVKVFESHRINAAFTFGYLKPIIVLPIGFFTSIPPEQIEAVLLHELYHIKHKDYLVNILTMTFEIIFFYHPVMWWLAKGIRKERENRCDDQVTQIINKKVYAYALLNMESYRQSLNHAIPFSNKHSNLKTRIMRIFEQKPEKNLGLKPFLSLLIMALFLMSFTFYKLDDPKIGSSKGTKALSKENLADLVDIEKSTENVLFKSENSRLGVLIEMTRNSLIAKSENEIGSLYIDDKSYALNEQHPFGENQIATTYELDADGSYHFFTREYFEIHSREIWKKDNEDRNTFVFDRNIDFFNFKPAKDFNSEQPRVIVEVSDEKRQDAVGNKNSIQKAEKKAADISEIKIPDPIQLRFQDKSKQNNDSNNLKLLKKLVKNFKADGNTEVQIKIDGKLIANGSDIEKALGTREINNIRIVMPSKDADMGTIDIITNDNQGIEVKEVPANEKVNTDDMAAEEGNIDSIQVYFMSEKLNYSGEVKYNAKKTSVLDALGFSDSDPLYVINDKIVGSRYKISDVDPNNIERLNVLKGKTATKKYGETAKNGAVEIYLKKQ